MSDENKTKNDDWKVHLFWFCIVAAIIFFDVRDDRTTLKQIGEIREQAKAVLSKSEELNDETSRFDTENWRDVVPHVKQAAENLLYQTESLYGEIDDLEQGLTPSAPEPGDSDPRH